MKKVSFFLLSLALTLTSVHCDSSDSDGPSGQAGTSAAGASGAGGLAGSAGAARDVIAAHRELGRAFVEDLEGATSPEAFAATLTRIIAPDYIQHNPLVPPGRDGLAAFSQALAQSFSDTRVTLHDVFATTDRVVARWTFAGTLTGQPFLGVAATGQKLEFDIQDEWSVKGEQLHEHWDQIDWTRALVQLGVAGPPAPFVQVAQQPVSRGSDGPGSNEPGTPELIAAHRELGRAFVEDLEGATSPEAFAAALTRVVSPDYIQHNPLVPPGRDGLAAFSQALAQSFSGVQVTLRESFATTDRVVARWTFAGTLTGQPFLGIAATGQKLEFDIFDIWTIEEGQLHEHWDQIDWTRALVQLGVAGLPAPFVQVAQQPVSR